MNKNSNLNIKTLSHPGIGIISIRKRIGSTSIRISVQPVKGVNVTIPYFTSYSSAVRFILSKQDWIISTLSKQKQKSINRQILLGVGHTIRTIQGEISFEILSAESGCISTGSSSTIKVTRKENNTVIKYKEGTSREILSSAVIKELRREAALFLPQRVRKLAMMNGFVYNRVFLKNNRTNWGSCSKLNNINLNIHLMRLDAEMADFVILHELCHLKHRNHGAGFHRMLDILCKGREKELSRRLRKELPGAL